MRKSRLIFGFVVLGMAMILAAFLGYSHFAREGPVPAVMVGGPFRLASANGGLVDTQDLRGRPYGVFFGFTHCPEVCPTTLFEVSQTLGELGEAAKDFRLFMITVDPERDTPAILKDYVGNFDPRFEALVPTPDELREVAKSFRAYYEKQPTSDGSYTMNHTAMVYLMDREGNFAGVIPYGDAAERRLATMRKFLNP